MLTGNWMRDRLDARRYKLGGPKVLYAAGLDDLLVASESRMPGHVREGLERARVDSGPFGLRGSSQGWEEVLYAPTADGAQVLNSAVETIMVPDFTLPGNYLQQGRMLKYTVFGDVSTVITTPGTITPRLRWGGVAGTVMAAGGAYAPDPTAASTTVSCYVEYFVIARAAPGAAASSFTMGRCWWNDYDDASAATIVANLNMHVIPVSAPAAVNIATNANNAITPTVAFSVATATTQFTAHMALLEALN